MPGFDTVNADFLEEKTHKTAERLGSVSLIDTPGMRELGLFGTDEGISVGFNDVEELFAECRLPTVTTRPSRDVPFSPRLMTARFRVSVGSDTLNKSVRISLWMINRVICKMGFGIEYPDELSMPINRALESVLDLDEPLHDEYILAGNYYDIIPCNEELTVTEMNLRNETGGEAILAEFLQPLKSRYEYIIIDTTPHSGDLTINALAASDSVLIPVSPEIWSATGLSDLLLDIGKTKRRINPRIEVE